MPCCGVLGCLQEPQQESQQSLIQQLKSQINGMAAVLPFASTTVIKASSSGQAEIYYGLAKAVDVSSVHCHSTSACSNSNSSRSSI
jgi:hypothetical protein